MEASLIIGIVLIVGVLIYQFSDLPKTLFLISTISPYEQVGTGKESLLVIGDSTGYGTGASSDMDSIAGRIGGDYPNLTIDNNSENGRKIAGANIVAQNLTDSYDVALLQIGANDILAGREIEVVIEDILRLIQMTRSHAEHVIIMTSGNIGAAAQVDSAEAERLQVASEMYSNAMTSLAADNDFYFINLYEDPATDPFVQEPEVYMAKDGLHPSSAGYAVWYEKLQPILQTVLDER